MLWGEVVGLSVPCRCVSESDEGSLCIHVISTNGVGGQPDAVVAHQSGSRQRD